MSELDHVHEWKFIVGDVEVPYRVHHYENKLAIEVGAVDFENSGTAFIEIELGVGEKGDVGLEWEHRGEAARRQDLGNILTSRVSPQLVSRRYGKGVKQ
ncbi:MAG: hypothetical protein ACYTFW_00245 [Planctomycetota bacterium]|jgi:hypothetical protein